ncbi:hypothetical protein A2W24_02340 [Microgenomates group bacterium RBG_16_45_19]|nr:MAG: hypothetical protein A2W24_02340 [Microgenomates group bacterium RBG_16_45_19]
MAKNDTVVNIDDTREVVIEPKKPPQVRLKQYVTVKAFTYKKHDYQSGDLVLLTEADATAFLSGRFLIPLEVALNQGIYPIAPESPLEKVVQAVTGEDIPDTPAEAAILSSSGGKKSFLGNRLRSAVQKKKKAVAATPITKIDLDKLAAIQSGGKPS